LKDKGVLRRALFHRELCPVTRNHLKIVLQKGFSKFQLVGEAGTILKIKSLSCTSHLGSTSVKDTKPQSLNNPPLDSVAIDAVCDRLIDFFGKDSQQYFQAGWGRERWLSPLSSRLETYTGTLNCLWGSFLSLPVLIYF